VVFDHVAAVNYSGRPLSLQLSATDAVETSGGGFGLLPNQAIPTGVGAWVSIPPEDATVRVPAASAHGPGAVVVPITVRVPLHATPGDHSGGVLVSLATARNRPTGQNVVLEQRVGTRVLMVVAGPLSPKLTVTQLNATYTGTLNPLGRGQVHLSFVITNAGNVNLETHLSAAFSGEFGSGLHASLRNVPLLLPGASFHGSVVIDGIWPQFLVRTTLTAQPQIVAPGQRMTLPALTTTSTTWAIPWTLILVVLALTLLAFWFIRRRRRHDPDSSPGSEQRQKSNQQKKVPAEVGA